MVKSSQLQQQVDLQPLHTFAMPAKADHYFNLSSISQLSDLAKLSRQVKQPVIILGAGSNTIFSGQIKSLVVHVALRGVQIISENADEVILQVAAGENWHQLVQYCVEHGYGGIENLALIPGTVGAAPVQNIGAYGVEISSVIEQVESFDLESSKIKNFSAEDCAFAYRDSVFKHPPYAGRYIITNLHLRLQKKPIFNLDYGQIKQHLKQDNLSPSLENIAQTVIKIRRGKLPDPVDLANAGSFFKNPIISAEKFAELKDKFNEIPHYILKNNKIKIPAGWLIESCGWKGKHIGALGCYKLQALILVNYGGATGNELQSLMQDIAGSVAKKFCLQLQAEVNLFGFTAIK